MLWRSLLHKEYRLLATPAFFAALTASWLALGLYLASGLVEYQAIAPKLAGLENRRGATETLLGSAAQLLQWLMILWTIYFGARSLAGEKLWHTDVLLRGVRGGLPRLLVSKTIVLLSALTLLTLPFWQTVAWIARSNLWDGKLLLALLLAQIFIALYAALLSLTISASQKQPLPASLLLALIWLLLWLLPVLTTNPPWLVQILRWLSPFEHLSLLYRGIATVQTLIYIALHSLLFITLMPLLWTRDTR